MARGDGGARGRVAEAAAAPRAARDGRSAAVEAASTSPRSPAPPRSQRKSSEGLTPAVAPESGRAAAAALGGSPPRGSAPHRVAARGAQCARPTSPSVASTTTNYWPSRRGDGGARSRGRPLVRRARRRTAGTVRQVEHADTRRTCSTCAARAKRGGRWLSVFAARRLAAHPAAGGAGSTGCLVRHRVDSSMELYERGPIYVYISYSRIVPIPRAPIRLALEDVRAPPSARG